MNLGKKVEKPATEPEPEWKAYKPGMEINAKGQLRTCRPPPQTPAEEFFEIFIKKVLGL